MTSPVNATEGDSRIPASYRWTLFCISIFALKLLLFAIDPRPKLYLGDSGSYIWTALSGWIPPDRSFFYGYVIRWIALWTQSLTNLVVFQVCLSTMTCILFSLTTRVIFELPERWSYGFGFLCAIDPLQLLYERYVMTETISLCLYAFVIYQSLLYVKNRRLRNLIAVQAVSVLLIGFRMSFLLQVQVDTIILPLIAFAPVVLQRTRRPPVTNASRMLSARVCAGHLLLSVTLMFLLHTGYKRINGWLSQREPDYLYTTGATLLAFWAPVLQPQDAPDPRLADLIRRGDEFGLRIFKDRNAQRFHQGRLIDRLSKIEPNPEKADSLAKKTALHALRRNPLGVLGISWRTYLSYWDQTRMKRSAVADFGFKRPPDENLRALLMSRFNLSYPKGTNHLSVTQWYYTLAWPYYYVILLAPLLSAFALALKSVRQYAFVLFIHIWIMMVMAMTFGSVSVRYLQPISFATLLVFALGVTIALQSVGRGQPIAGERRSNVRILRPNPSNLV